MTEPSNGVVPREVVALQLCLLDLYEALLEIHVWDEGKLNAVLKAFMASVVALMRAQRSAGSQVFTAQKDWVRQYRAQLEQWLEEQGDAADGGLRQPGQGGGH